MDGRGSVSRPRQNAEILEADAPLGGDEGRGGGSSPGYSEKSEGVHSSRSGNSGGNRTDGDASFSRPASDPWESEATSRPSGIVIDDRMDVEDVSFGAGLGIGPASQPQQYSADTSDSEALLQADGNGSSSVSGTSKVKSRLKHFSFSRSITKPDALLSSIGGSGTFEQLSGPGNVKGGGGGEGEAGGASSSGVFLHGRELDMAPSTPRFHNPRASLPTGLISRSSDRSSDALSISGANRRLTYPPARGVAQPGAPSATSSSSGNGERGLDIGGGLGGALNNPLTIGAQIPREGLSKMPKYSRLSQQELSLHGSLLLTPKVMIGVLLVVAVVFIPIGAITFGAARSVVEYRFRYDEWCLSRLPSNRERDERIRNLDSSHNCTMPLELDRGLRKGTVAVYYELSRFYANHRRYVDSRDNRQLRGESSVPGACTEQKVSDGQPVLPCGIVAWSFFNDSFVFEMVSDGTIDPAINNNLTVHDNNLAWKSRKNSYSRNVFPINFNVNQTTRGGGTITGSIRENERFIVWMQAPALHTVRKLWGRIRLDYSIRRNTTLLVHVSNFYNSYAYDGEKTLILSTTSWLGGNNDFVGVSFFMVGCLALFLAVMFSILLVLFPRPLGDLGMLSWNRLHDETAKEAQSLELAKERLPTVAESQEDQANERRSSLGS